MSSLRIHCLQHVSFEDPGCIKDWIKEKGHQVTYTHLYNNEKLPAIDDIDLLIVLGGPLSVNDEAEYPWLKEEKEFIAKYIAANKKVLGLCLGAQLIAAALGKDVYPNKEKEIGWWPVQMVKAGIIHPLYHILPDTQTFFHWHGETFDLPDDSIHIFKSEACTNQGFLLKNNVLGLQFHPEANLDLVMEMVENEGRELSGKKFVQSEVTVRSGTQHCKPANAIMFLLMDYLAYA